MIGKIAAFELRYQLKNPVFWVGFFIFFLLGFGLTASDNVSIGTPGVTKENGAFPIMLLMAISTVFYLFVLTAFVANAIVRDDSSGFAPIIRATPLTKSEMIFGRFIGAYAIAVIGFIAVPLGMFVGTLMPWVDPENVGPHVFSYYAWPFLIFVLPNLFFSSALLFAVATMTRSLMWSYVAVIALVMAYLAFETIAGGSPELERTFAQFEPFGAGALSLETRYWSGAEFNNRLIEFSGILLTNRLIVIGLGIGLLALAYARYSSAERPISRRKAKKLEKRKAKEAKLAEVAPAAGGLALSTEGRSLSRWSQFKVRLATEVQQMLRSPGVPILIVLALGFTATGLWGAETAYGNSVYPTTAATISNVRDNFSIFIFIIAAFYGGELVWRERERKLNEIVDSTPTPAWAMTIPKVIAIFLLLVMVNLSGMLMGLLYQATAGAPALELGKWFGWFIIPSAIDGLLIAVLAIILQILSPNKFVGWGLLLAYFLLNILLVNLGFTNPLFRYAASPFVPLSDMVDPGIFFQGAYVMQFYWLLFAGLLILAAHLLWPRGTDLSLRQRFARVKRGGVSKGAATIGAVLLAGFVSLGFVINHNINDLNTFRTSDENEARLADYERKYLKYEDVAQPLVTDVQMTLDLFPEERRLETEGAYTMRNHLDEPIETLHVRAQSEDADFSLLAVEGASLETEDKDFGYRIYRFEEPLAPGAEAVLQWRSTVDYEGFRAGGPPTGITPDKTFVNNGLFAPAIGMDRSGLLQDRTVRRRNGLPDELRPPKLEDEEGTLRNYIGTDWVTSDITLSTDADQIPIAPGERVEDSVADGRRTARFVASSPILNFFSVQSGDYEVASREYNGINLEVYYEEGHEWNVPRMLDAMEASLGYYEREFGPYQFDYARIIEFPYASFAQAFAGTMPYSENIGFRSKLDGTDDVDFVTYVIAHELAHQYWAHQALGGYQQGSTMTTETLASYSAIMVMKELLGDDQLRRFLKYELDGYLRGRKGEIIEELPLVRVENQGYIHYQKGAVAMHLLAERLGEDDVNRALAAYLSKHKFAGPPYPRSSDIVSELYAVAENEAERQLVADMLERVVLYDYELVEAETREEGGAWVTELTVRAAKYEADGQGNEEERPLDQPVKYGLFDARPGFGSFDEDDVILVEEEQLATGEHRLVLRSERKPAYAGIDPYNFMIDRNSDDNVKPVTEG